MSGSSRKLPKGVVLQHLETQLVHGRTLLDRQVATTQELFTLSIDRLEWTANVHQLLTQMTRGVQVVADFRRAVATQPLNGPQSFEDQVLAFKRQTAAQLEVLRKAVDRWAKSGTRPLQ